MPSQHTNHSNPFRSAECPSYRFNGFGVVHLDIEHSAEWSSRRVGASFVVVCYGQLDFDNIERCRRTAVTLNNYKIIFVKESS